MARITTKKKVVPVSSHLRRYLVDYGRELKMPINYDDLTRYTSSIPLYDKLGENTLWETVFYSQGDMKDLYNSLKKMYSILKASGDMSVMQHLEIERVDLCTYGNTKPFRVRIVNKINDNFDYYYIKRADASRIYGMELEHILSPNRISYVVDGTTLIEEHIAGIPGDVFIKKYLHDEKLIKIRLAKEFVKFNERCFVRLLGDMHSGNYVVEITPDFEDTNYRIRAIDFDQQSYEGRLNIYMPKYYKENNPIIQLGLEVLTPESVVQYQKEERSLIANRLRASKYRIKELGDAVAHDRISAPEKVKQLRQELAGYYSDPDFLTCESMGEIVRASLRRLLKNF